MTDDLATWLLEQIAEDERVAKMASGTPWETGVLDPRSVHVVMDGSRERRQLGYVATAETVAEHARYAASTTCLSSWPCPTPTAPANRDEWRTDTPT